MAACSTAGACTTATESCFSSLFTLPGWNLVRANKNSQLRSTACRAPDLQAWLVAAAYACSQLHLKQLLGGKSSVRGPALPSIQHEGHKELHLSSAMYRPILKHDSVWGPVMLRVAILS